MLLENRLVLRFAAADAVNHLADHENPKHKRFYKNGFLYVFYMYYVVKENDSFFVFSTENQPAAIIYPKIQNSFRIALYLYRIIEPDT